jgi:antitoxin ParD1/3/4
VPTGNVVLTEHHVKVITDLVASGRYQNASEVMPEGLRLIEEHDSRDAAKLTILQDAARAGFADFDMGRFVELYEDTIEDIISDLGRKAESQSRRAAR